MGKNRGPRNKDSYKRRENVKPVKPLILIVCEGKKTEPNYFKSFELAEVRVIGLGANTVSLVTKAIELKADGEYDQVWCVFDRDSFKTGQFYRAIMLAEQNGMQTAYSNEAFELWYVLHFDYLDTAITRVEYQKRLTRLLGKKYQKNDTEMYDLLLHHRENALKNAKNLMRKYESGSNPEHNKPSTTVHLLVEELLKFKLS
ncbi:MAG: RloB family protein [Bacilli bacterium]